jgi:hypothetical protein
MQVYAKPPGCLPKQVRTMCLYASTTPFITATSGVCVASPPPCREKNAIQTNSFINNYQKFIKMTTSITTVNNGEQSAKLAEAVKNGAKSLSGGLTIPEGIHEFLTAEKDAFGILNLKGTSSGDWALPIVAGTMTLAVGKEKETFVLSTRPGTKNLIIPDAYFVTMQANMSYSITVEMRKGKKVVTNVQMSVFEENVIPDDKVRTSPPKKKALAF